MAKTKTWKHFAAFLYDLFPVLGILLLTNLLVLFLRNGVEVKANTPWFSLLIFFEVAFYYIYSWKIGGQTLGMRAWKIKIVQADTNMNIDYMQSCIRFVVGVVSTFCFGLGLFWKLFSKERKSWMDSASRSITVSTES